MRNIFYKTDNLNLKAKKKILRDAKSKCYNWWVDILDCNKSWSRQRIDMPFENIIKKLKNNSHFVIIHRKGYEPKNQKDINDVFRWKLEFGFSTLGLGPSYFLWIYVEQEQLKYFIDKYNLETIL